MQRKLHQQYQSLKKQLLKIGYICQGSVGRVYTRCGNDYCPCAKNERHKHGPYYLWTRKEKAKTVSKRLDKMRVERLKSYIKNFRSLKNTIKKMKQLSEKAIYKEI